MEQTIPKLKTNLDTNLLKLIAIISMTLDHVGSVFFPQIPAFRWIGRLAFPIFCYCMTVELEHTGTLEDPIPYPETPGIVVNVKSGLYYSYKGSIYKAKGDMPNCVYPPDTPGMWQWERVEG